MQSTCLLIAADPWKPESALNAVPKDVLLKCKGAWNWRDNCLVRSSWLSESFARSQLTKGIAVFTIVKAGFVFSGKAGSGIVIARLPDGSWSAPSCIATAGEPEIVAEC